MEEKLTTKQLRKSYTYKKLFTNMLCMTITTWIFFPVLMYFERDSKVYFEFFAWLIFIGIWSVMTYRFIRMRIFPTDYIIYPARCFPGLLKTNRSRYRFNRVRLEVNVSFKDAGGSSHGFEEMVAVPEIRSYAGRLSEKAITIAYDKKRNRYIIMDNLKKKFFSMDF